MIIINKISKYFAGIGCVLLMIFICLYPKEIITSARTGLLLWYNSVLPSIFPFLITSNVLIEIGAVSRLGRILEPIMRPIFNVPGCGAFAFLMGGMSGYPVGAKITADLRESGKVTRVEAQRLVSFCNNSGPLFMIGAVGTAILGSAWAGYFILITNYISAIVVGLLFRFYKGSEKSLNITNKAINRNIRVHGALPLGKVLGNAVSGSIEVVLQIGGFIVLFSVLINVLKIAGILAILAKAVYLVLSPTGITQELATPVASGIVEITNGIKMVGGSGAPYYQKVIISGALVTFSGLSIFAQTASFISKTDISVKIYFLSKLLQTVIQVCISVLLYPFVSQRIEEAVTVMKPLGVGILHSMVFSFISVMIVLVLVCTGIALSKKSRQGV